MSRFVSADSSRQARRHQLLGRVQGLGVRPAIARLAQQLNLQGTVCNTRDGVTIEVMGENSRLDLFSQRLLESLPVGCEVTEWLAESTLLLDEASFRILPADSTDALAAHLPPDRRICETCQQEVNQASHRRRGYLLNSCAQCGPRYSLIETMPFERERTSLRSFELCAACRHEYTDPHDRRFHAQTIGCLQCGPQVWLSDRDGKVITAGQEMLELAVACLRRGELLGVRGIGGYQLLCDATHPAAVARLRQAKARPVKPLAVLVKDIQQAAQFGVLTDTERDCLTAASNPIVLLRHRSGSRLASNVSADSPCVGLLLPTTALHQALLDRCDVPLVCSSANRDGEPLAYSIPQSDSEAAGLADLWLHHDREILRPLDDSVVRVIAGQAQTVRLARGLVPLQLPVTIPSPGVAAGGDLKAAIAWSNGSQAVLGPYVGDLSGVATRERYLEGLPAARGLYGFRPQWLAYDLHPDYFSSRWAQAHDGMSFPVQHHVAHAAAVLLEHRRLNQEVLAVAWDGAGWGEDDTLWGSEFLRMSLPADVERVACLRPMSLPGGDRAAREPWRMAVSLLTESLPATEWLELLSQLWPMHPVQQLHRWLQRSSGPWLRSTGMGRLFDAVAALILGVETNAYEGHAAQRLEGLALACQADLPPYPLPSSSRSPVQLDWRPLITAIWQDRQREVAREWMAFRFHRTLAAVIGRQAARFPALPLVLCGGVFQNQCLTELVCQQSGSSSSILRPRQIPTNDSGLAAGQLAVASLLIARQHATGQTSR